jgi:hypothetical protein
MEKERQKWKKEGGGKDRESKQDFYFADWESTEQS